MVCLYRCQESTTSSLMKLVLSLLAYCFCLRPQTCILAELVKSRWYSISEPHMNLSKSHCSIRHFCLLITVILLKAYHKQARYSDTWTSLLKIKVSSLWLLVVHMVVRVLWLHLVQSPFSGVTEGVTVGKGSTYHDLTGTLNLQ